MASCRRSFIDQTIVWPEANRGARRMQHQVEGNAELSDLVC